MITFFDLTRPSKFRVSIFNFFANLYVRIFQDPSELAVCRALRASAEIPASKARRDPPAPPDSPDPPDPLEDKESAESPDPLESPEHPGWQEGLETRDLLEPQAPWDPRAVLDSLASLARLGLPGLPVSAEGRASAGLRALWGLLA